MNISEDKIDDFVYERLSKVEMDRIREMVKSDPDLATAIDNAKLAKIIANKLISDDIRTMTNQWRDTAKNNKNDQQSKDIINTKSILLLISGLILFTIITIVIYNYSNNEKVTRNGHPYVDPLNSDSLPDSLNKTNQKITPTNTKEEFIEKSLDNKDVNKNIQHNNQRKLIASRLMPPLQKETVLRSASNTESKLKAAQIIELYNQKDLKGLKLVLTRQKKNSAIQILTKELIARTLFENGSYQKAVNIFEELVGYDMPNREDYEFMLLLSYYITQPLQNNKYNDIKNKIAKDKDHTYYSKIIQLK